MEIEPRGAEVYQSSVWGESCGSPAANIIPVGEGVPIGGAPAPMWKRSVRNPADPVLRGTQDVCFLLSHVAMARNRRGGIHYGAFRRSRSVPGLET